MSETRREDTFQRLGSRYFVTYERKNEKSAISEYGTKGYTLLDDMNSKSRIRMHIKADLSSYSRLSLIIVR